MIYISVAYRIKDKIFIGVSEKDSAGYYSIKEFVPALNLKLDNYSTNFLYVVMVSETDESKEMYLLEKISITDYEGNLTTTLNLGEDDFFDMSNRLLKNFKDRVTFH